MRKRNNKGRILSRPKNQRKALLKSLATSLFLHSKIKTTEAKAKELRSKENKIKTRAKDAKRSDKGNLSQTLSPVVLKKLIEEIAPEYKSRNGGYTRIIRLGQRKSDGANMAIVELVK